MKKYLYFLILTFLSFIPILKVEASTSSNLDSYFSETNTKSFEFMYQNNDYLMNKLANYDYKMITTQWSTLGMTNGRYWFITSLYGFENEVFLSNYYRSGYQSYLSIKGNPTRYNITFYYYYDSTTDKFYSDKTFTTEISSITDNLIQIEATNTDKVRISDNFSSASTSYDYRLYFNNIKLDNTGSYHRPITLYDINNELVGTYNTGDILPSYVSLYHSVPSYLNGYEKVGLTPSDNTIIISNITKGSIFISVEDFNKCNGLFGYFDKDLISQPYSSVITDYTTMLDGLYIRQDFDISTYPGADYVYYQKCQIVDDTDDIYKYIWLPDTSYNSNITSTENSTGGLDYSYNVEENGEIVENTFSSLDNILDSNNPLLNDFFNNFSTNYFGISSIITAPLSLINQLGTATCSPLVLPFPFSDKELTLPCMTEIYQNNFGQLFNLYQFLLLGFTSYRLAVAFFYDIKKLKDPNNDEVEVMSL